MSQKLPQLLGNNEIHDRVRTANCNNKIQLMSSVLKGKSAARFRIICWFLLEVFFFYTTTHLS